VGHSQFQGGVLKKDSTTLYLSQKIFAPKKISKKLYTQTLCTHYLCISLNVQTVQYGRTARNKSFV